MRTRFLVSVALTDLLSLALAVGLASLLVFDTALPWQADIVGSVWPMLGFMAGGLIVSSMVTEQMSGHGVPRPTYGRMVAILAGTFLITAAMLVLFRTYFSRPFLLLAAVTWLIPATTHRVIRRRRPWTEKIGVITHEKQLAEDLDHTDHADVVWLLSPNEESPMNLPDRDVTIAIDLRAVLSDSMAQYLSSCDVAGYQIRPFSSIYEDHTGRVPLVHLAEGWEISAPLLEVARWLPGKNGYSTSS